jgi:hypothetical protein
MLSDVLFDAVAQIEKYQQEYRDTYWQYAPELEVLKGRMRGTALKLAAPPDLMQAIRDGRQRAGLVPKEPG